MANVTVYAWNTTFNQDANGGTVTWFYFPVVSSSGQISFNGAGGTLSRRNKATNNSAYIVQGQPVPPTAIILGIGLAFLMKCDSGTIAVNNIQVAKNGVFAPANLSDGFVPGLAYPAHARLYGGIGQFWGTTWTPADINNNLNFGMQVLNTFTVFDTFYTNGVNLFVYWGAPPPTGAPPYQNLRHYRLRR